MALIKPRRPAVNKKLTKKIEKQLDKLSHLLDNFEEARILNADDPETWDADALYDLAEQLKEALRLLEGKKQTDRYGEELILEEGLCSLIDDYQSEQEEEDDD